ncbi:MAG: hypothetical protein AABZ60_23240 [Planctomycetota bacterium]
MIGLSALSSVLPIGSSLENVLGAVLLKKNGFKSVTEYDTTAFYNPQGGLLDQIPFPESFPVSKTRRLSRLSKIFLSTFLKALDHYGPIPYLPEERGLILATSHGSLESCIAYHETLFRSPHLVSPMLFTEGGFNAGISHLSIHGNFQGTLQSLSGDENVGLSTILMAKTLLESSSQKVIFTGGAYEWTRLAHQVYDRLSLGKLTLGEGASFLVLESSENLHQRKISPDCWIQDGFGFHLHSMHLSHLSDLHHRILDFLERNHLHPHDIDLFITGKNQTEKDPIFQFLQESIWTQSEAIHPLNYIGESFACSSSFQASLGAMLLKQKKYRKAIVFSYSCRGNGTLLLLTAEP